MTKLLSAQVRVRPLICAAIFMAAFACTRVGTLPDAAVILDADAGTSTAPDSPVQGESEGLSRADAPGVPEAADSDLLEAAVPDMANDIVPESTAPGDSDVLDIALETVQPTDQGPDAIDGPVDATILDAVKDIGEVDVAQDVADGSVDATEVEGGPVDAAIDVSAVVPNWNGTPYTAACGKGPILPVDAADKTCKTQCPAPYPCVCGTCGWLQTPPMTIPRMYHSAVWTGKYVVVIGGFHPSTGWTGVKVTAERWDPSSPNGFEEIPLGQPALPDASNDVEIVWSGKEVLIFPDSTKLPWLRYDPSSGAVKTMKKPGNINPNHGATMVGSKVLMIASTIGIYDPETETGEQVVIPESLIVGGAKIVASSCTFADGEYLYVYDPAVVNGAGKQWVTGVPVEDGAILRLHVPTMKWILIGWDANIDIRCPVNAAHVAIAIKNDTLFVKGKMPFLPTGTAMAVDSLITGGWSPLVALPLAEIESSYEQLAVLTAGLLVPSNRNVLPGSKGGYSQYPGNYVFSAPLYFEFASKSWRQLPPWGQPTDGRVATATVVTSSDVIVLGGVDGPPDIQIVHADGVRFPLLPITAGEIP